MTRSKRKAFKSGDPSPPLILLKRATAAARNAYAPYSRFAVGAAVQAAGGRVFTGANMENASYGLTLCAEAGALQAASSAGVLAKIRRMVIVGGPIERGKPYRRAATPPCGRCRQLIAEAAQVAGHDVEVWYGGLDGKVLQRRTITELLPEAFGRGNLDRRR
jgi:cytidine deaminase